MLILDTDHLSELDRMSPAGVALSRRLEFTDQRVTTSIISIDEQLRGLLALIKTAKTARKTIPYYKRLDTFLIGIAAWDVLQFDEPAAQVFEDLKRLKLGIGTMDAKIAAIAMVHGGKLLSRNLRDFTLVPNLDVEDWT